MVFYYLRSCACQSHYGFIEAGLSITAWIAKYVFGAYRNKAQHFSYGARVLFARPRERSERLKLFVVPLQ
jgi:hypothetical protein